MNRVPGVPDVTGSRKVAPQNGRVLPPPVNIAERIETLTDGMFTANRASIALRREVEALRFAVLLVGIVLVATYVVKGK